MLQHGHHTSLLHSILQFFLHYLSSWLSGHPFSLQLPQELDDDDSDIDDKTFQQWKEIANDEELLDLVLDYSQLTLDGNFTDNSDSSVDLSSDVHTYASLLPDMVFE